MPDTDPTGPGSTGPGFNPCFPGKPITISVVQCKNSQPILMFALSQKTTGDMVSVNNGTNHWTACLLASDTITVSANGYQTKDVTVSPSDFNSGYMVVCLDEVAPLPPPRKPWPYCFVLTVLGIDTDSEYANILRKFRDVLLGTSGGRRFVSYYYDEIVQKELINHLKKPNKLLEIFRILIEATPVIMEFVRSRSSLFGGGHRCDAQIRLDVSLAERAVTLLTALSKEVEDKRTKEALAFACSLVEKAAGKLPGQILDMLISEFQEKPAKNK